DPVDDLGYRHLRIIAAGVGRVAGVHREEVMGADGEVRDGEGHRAAAEGRRGDDGVGVTGILDVNRLAADGRAAGDGGGKVDGLAATRWWWRLRGSAARASSGPESDWHRRCSWQ